MLYASETGRVILIVHVHDNNRMVVLEDGKAQTYGASMNHIDSWVRNGVWIVHRGKMRSTWENMGWEVVR